MWPTICFPSLGAIDDALSSKIWDFLCELLRSKAASAATAQHAQRRAAATQTADIGPSAVVDTRLLGKPVAFDGQETIWRSFKFQFAAYSGAIDSRLKDLLVLGESRHVGTMRNIHMDPDTRALSAQLYYMLIMVCLGRWSPSSWQPSVEGAQSLPRSARSAPSLTWQRSSWVSLRPGGLDTGTLVLRADQETSLTALLDEIKARRAKTLLERTVVGSYPSIVAVERMNREVASLLRTLKAALEARISGKVAVDHNLISWLTHQAPQVRRNGREVWRDCLGEDPHPRRSSASWTSVGSRSHIGLDHRGTERSRAVRREPQSSKWMRSDSRECWMLLGS